jgi:hypothetical protein
MDIEGVVLGVVFAGVMALVGIVTQIVLPNLDEVRSQRKALSDKLREQLGAKPLSGRAMSIERPEGRVTVDWVSPGREPHLQAMELVLDLPCHLPALEIHPKATALSSGDDFDGRFTTRVRELGSGDLLVLPKLRRAVLALSLRHDTWQGAVTLTLRGTRTGSRLRVLKEGWVEEPGQVATLVDQLCAMGRTLQEGWDAPWLALAEGFALGEICRSEDGLRVLQGELSGYAFRIEEVVDGHEGLTRFLLALRTDPALQVVRKERARAEGWAGITTGNPVLDMCVAVRSGDMESVKALLSRDGVTEALLPLIHGRDAQLDPSGLKLELEGFPREGLEELVEEVAELARVFRAQATEDSPRA